MYAQVAFEGETVSPISNKRIASLETKRVIFFAGDAITPREKHEMPEIKGFGGIYLPHVRTLPKGKTQASRGMVYRCKFTSLTTKMQSEPAGMLSPEARSHWESEFSQEIDGQERTISGFQGSNPALTKDGQFGHLRSNHLVHKKRYPGHDVKMATARSLPNGVGGVVEITALQGASNEEIRAAQLFFFPRWDMIEAGMDTLPETTDELEKYIKSRLLTISQDDFSETASKYRLIGRDMLQSCADFKRTGAQIVHTDEKAAKAAAKDDNQTYSAVSTHLLGQLNLTRKEDVVTGGNEAINRLASTLEKTLVPSASPLAGMNDAELAEYYAWKASKNAPSEPVEAPVAAFEPQEDVAVAPGVETASSDPLPTLEIGAEVIYDNRAGKVIAKPFGRFKVEFEDGSTQMADRDELS